MKIADIIEKNISGDWGNDAISDDYPCEVYCVRGADIEPIKCQDYDHLPKRFIAQRSFNNKLLRPGDIVIEKSGGSPTQSTGRVCLITYEMISRKHDIVCSNFCAAFRVKSEWDPEYIYLYLQYIYNCGVFFNFEGKTSGLKNLQMDQAFNAIEIKPIPLDEQKRLAKCISVLDSKMSINRAINQNLVAMAKQLYDYWFVQFDFPNEEGKPYKSTGGAMQWCEKLKRDIPVGWEVKPLKEICTVKDGTHDSPKPQTEGLPLITSKHLLSSGLDFKNAYLISKEDFDVINKRSKVEQYDILFSMIGTIGNKYFVNEKVINFAIKNMALIKTSEIEGLMYYIMYNLGAVDYVRYENNALSGSIQKFLSLDAMRNIPILYNEKLMSLYNEKVRHYQELYVINKEENILLLKQKEELLPLLMNGQASITPLNSDLHDRFVIEIILLIDEK